MARMSRAYIKKRLIDLMDYRVNLIEQINNCPSDWEFIDLMEHASRFDESLNFWKKRLDRYQDPQPWKGDGRYVCHVDIPEEYEA